jgi:hypothetical protein
MRRAFDASLSFASLKDQLERVDGFVGGAGLVVRNPRTGQADVSELRIVTSVQLWMAMVQML